ncbi:MAG: recombinase family protein, partial [Ruminococcus sp.]|nr:recombinase family protein [Ruminococcus sp.]
EQSLNERLEQIKAENSIGPDDSDRIERTLKEIDKNSCELLEYNDILTRKLIECVRVVSKTEIQIIFKGGYEVTAEVEK